MSDLLDRYRGALFGLAVGDALGAPVEFLSRDQFVPVTGYRTGGRHNMAIGEWTDDTAQALCLAHSLVETGCFDLHDQASRYLRWMEEGYCSTRDRIFDIGMATVLALGSFKKDGNPRAGSFRRKSSGNGCVMRLAPIPMRYRADPYDAIRLAGESARVTHQSDLCIAATELLCAYILAAMTSEDKVFLELTMTPFGWMLPRDSMPDEILRIMQGSFCALNTESAGSTGYVVTTLESALWAFYSTSSFRDCVLAAVNLGQDSDSLGAVAGQIAGAYYGFNAIPADWIDAVHSRTMIDELAIGLHNDAERAVQQSGEEKAIMAIVDRVREGSKSRLSTYHGESHWKSVAEAGLELLHHESCNSPVSVFLFALLHDSMRAEDGDDPEHGARAAGLARNMLGSMNILSEEELTELCNALERHDVVRRTIEPTAAICWDADRLQLWRVGTTPEVSYLSTETARLQETIASYRQPKYREREWLTIWRCYRAREKSPHV